MADAPNLLYYGDNLDVLRRHVASESVDLVYLDPPFHSNADGSAYVAEQDSWAFLKAAKVKKAGGTTGSLFNEA